MCLGVWVMIYAVELPTHLGWGDKRFSVVFFVCTFANHVHSYAMFYIGLGVLFPIGASFGAYLGIYLKVRNSTLFHRRINSRSMDKVQSKNDRAKHRASRRMFRENVRVAQALFRVFLIFVIMWLPVAILILMGKGTQVPHVWYILTILLAHGNSSINCIVYAASIEHFREGYFKILGIKRRQRESFLSAEKHALADFNMEQPLIDMGVIRISLNVKDSVCPEKCISTGFAGFSTDGARLLPS
jgi:7 transmembrane receptor (rhodopsin family)